MRTRDLAGLAATLACLAALLILTAVRYQPPAPRPASAAPEVFSAERAAAVLRQLLGDERPHPMGSAANAAVRERILEQLAALGYQATTQSGVVCDAHSAVCGQPVNIIARLPGIADSAGGSDGSAILLAAHYDSVAAGPGASDDGAGVATVLEIARALKHGPTLRHTVIFLLDDGEEAGLLGARLFVQQHPWAPRVKAAVNLEARGTSGPSFMFETGTANRWLMQRYQSAVAQPVTNSLYYAVYKLLPNDTDFTVFKAAGYQGYNFAFLGDVAHYHTPRDDLAHLDLRSLQHQGDNALHTLRALATAPWSPPPADEAVYFDLFRLTLVQWPATAAVPAALLLLVLLAGAGAGLLHQRRITARELLWGCAGTLAIVAGSVLTASGVYLALRLAGSLPPAGAAPWIAHPGPALAGFVALAFATGSGLSVVLARRTGFWGATLGHALLAAALGLLVASLLPGASFLLLVPAAAGGVALLPAAAGRGSATALRIAAAGLPAGASFAVLLPLLFFLYDALGALAWPILTGALGLGVSALLPLLIVADGSTRRGLCLTATLLAGAGIVTTAALPTYSAAVPQRLNLEYRRDAEPGTAHWVALAEALQLPPELARAATFAAPPGPYPPGDRRQAHFAVAPDLPLPAPELRVLSATPEGNRTRYRAHLVSPRGAPEVQLRFAAGTPVHALTLESVEGAAAVVPLPLRDDASGGRNVTIKALPAAGWQLTFETPRDTPPAIQVRDRSPDFPAQGHFLQAARSPLATPSREGDGSVVSRTVRLPAAP